MPNYLDLININLNNIAYLSELFWQGINHLIIFTRKPWIILHIINFASLFGHLQTPQSIKYRINVYILCFHINLLHKLDLIIFFARKSDSGHKLGVLFRQFWFVINFIYFLWRWFLKLRLFWLLVLLSCNLDA